MTYELISVIVETDKSTNDLFPGISSSVFDEHNTLQSRKRSHSDESEWIDKQIERITLLQKSKSRERNTILQNMRNKDLYIVGHSAGSKDIQYDTLPWLKSKFPLAYEWLEDYHFNPKSPAFSDIPKYASVLDRVLSRVLELEAKLKKTKARGSTVRRAASASEMKRQKASASTASIPESSIPKKIPVKFFDGTKRFTMLGQPTHTWISENTDNPYWSTAKNETVIKQYAGHPAHYDWQKRQKTQFFLLNKLVKELGLPELNVLYLKHHKVHKYPVFYMGNADNSFQMFQQKYGKDFYVKDTTFGTWDTFVTIDTITKMKDTIDSNANQIPKHGKRP